MEQKQKTVNVESIINKNHNKGIIILLLVVISGYVFFLLSPVLFHETPDKSLTELNTEIGFINGRLTVDEWIYSSKQHIMEVCCSTTGFNPKEIMIESSCNYTYRSKGSSPLKCEIGYSTSDYFVVFIYEIPEDFYCVSIRGTEQPTTETNNTASTDNEYEPEDNEETSFGYIYTCVDDVEKVDKINVDKTDNEFTIEKTERQISFNEDMIEANDAVIKQLKSNIEEYRENIKTIKSEKSFQIESEREKSDGKINELENTISGLNQQITQLETENARLKKEISDYKTVIWMLKG